MTKKQICTVCGRETVRSNTERGRRRNFRWCKNCNRSRRGDDVIYLYTACNCCGTRFEPWSRTPYCEPCISHGCDGAASFLPYCLRETERAAEPDQREKLDLTRPETTQQDSQYVFKPDDKQVRRPELPVHSTDTCPDCGSDSVFINHFLVVPFDDDYVEGVDQSETYYRCTDCGTEWRFEENNGD